MCKIKTEGGRCFYHARIELTKNLQRVERDERILNDSQELSPAEQAREEELRSRSDLLTKTEAKELQYLERVRKDNQELTATEMKHYLNNRQKTSELEKDVNTAAVVGGAARKKELTLLRGEIIRQYMETSNDGVFSKRRLTLLGVIDRLDDDLDSPLTEKEAALADEIYAANPALFNEGRVAFGGNGRSKPLTEASYAERVDLVNRYNALSPANAPEEQKAAYAAVQTLQRDYGSWVVLNNPNSTEEDKAALPKMHRKFATKPAVFQKMVAHALVQDARVEVYGVLSIEAERNNPRLYKAAPDRASMDAARASLHFGPQGDVVKLKKALTEKEVLIRSGDFAKIRETQFRTQPPSAAVAELNGKPAAATSASGVTPVNSKPVTGAAPTSTEVTTAPATPIKLDNNSRQELDRKAKQLSVNTKPAPKETVATLPDHLATGTGGVKAKLTAQAKPRAAVVEKEKKAAPALPDHLATGTGGVKAQPTGQQKPRATEQVDPAGKRSLPTTPPKRVKATPTSGNADAMVLPPLPVAPVTKTAAPVVKPTTVNKADEVEGFFSRLLGLGKRD